MSSILDLPPADAARRIEHWLTEHDEPAYRLRQVVPRLWQRPIRSWAEATDLPVALRAQLDDAFPLPTPTLVRRQESVDGTVKFLWRFGASSSVESVWIPDRRRRTLCVSSQEGCAYGCQFCATGQMGFLRHLTPGEIAAQVRQMVIDPRFGRPTNVVFMGMGEPLHNWDAVDTALTILNDPSGLGIGARHITVSTVGLVPGLRKLAERPEQFSVAWSLHAADSTTRRWLMPVEQKYPISEVTEALRAFHRRVTLEFVLIRGINDAQRDADALVAIARELQAHVNLLPLHPGGADTLAPTGPERIRAFAAQVRRHGVNVTVRESRGLDIAAACGQLRTTGERASVATQHDAHIEQPE